MVGSRRVVADEDGLVAVSGTAEADGAGRGGDAAAVDLRYFDHRLQFLLVNLQ